MRAQAKVRGLRSIKTVTNQGQRSRLEVLNELAQLQRAKVMMTQEKENWQKKIDFIDVQLEQIAGMEKWLHQFLKEEDSVPDNLKESSRKVIMNEESVNTVTIRY